MNHPFAARSLIDPAPGDGRSPTYGTPHGPNGDPLLSAKLSIPPVPPAYLSRNRLFELLTGATKRGVTAIHGPAGSGKTALTAGWVRAGQAPGPVAWLTLDGEDNAPGMFWTYILHALRRNASRLAPDVPAPTRPDLVDRSTLTRLATALAERAQPIVLVLDGAEQISNRSIAADLDMLVRYSTPGLRLIVVGRSARLIPLQRYQLSGELTEIDADDLALTREEAVKILRSYPANLTDDGIAHLHDSTGGWMTGVCLHALALEPGGGEPVRRPSAAGNHAIAEFLRTEVLDPQPSRVRDLLVRTSIAETVHPDLADRLTGRLDARGIFQDLVRANAFVRPVDEARFRCADPLREVLREELHTRQPHLVQRLHAEAAHWYAEQNEVPQALRHAVRIGDWDYAATLAATRLGVVRLLTAPDAEPLRALLCGLPRHQTGFSAALLRAVLALARFDTEVARAAVNEAARYAGQRLDERSIPMQVDIWTVRVVLARLTGNVETAEAAAAEVEALWQLRSAPDPDDGAGNRALVLANVGVAQFWAGRYQAARATLGRAATATGPGTEYAIHDALAHLSLLDVYDGRLQRAARYARASLAVADRAGLGPAVRTGAANAALAGISLLWNDLPAVREHLSRVIAAAGSRHDPPTATAVALLRAHVACARLDGRRALAAVEAARAGAGLWRVYRDVADIIEMTALGANLILGDTVAARRCLESVSDNAERALALGRIRLAEGDPKEARSILATVPKRHARSGTMVYAALTLGRLAFAEGNVAGAAQAVREALDHGRQDQLRRPFVEAGAWVRQVLRQYPDLAAQHGWLSGEKSGPPPDAGGAPVVEPLTEREVEVLGRLAQALSTEDIANALYLSVNTVKTHLKSIYRKLGTSGRSATARRARELKLLPVTELDDR